MINNVHAGHRERMRQRFISQGLDSFQDHQVLELLLFYAKPMVDTNVIAHDLMNKFGSLSSVFDADVSELTKVNGITQNAAVLIKMIPAILNKYKHDSLSKNPLTSNDKITEYFMSIYNGIMEEELKVCCLDDNLNIISCATVIKGTPDSIPVSARKIAEFAIRSNSSLIAIAHNHPNGVGVPSSEDISTTRQLLSTLRNINIKLVDHVIVGKDSATSMCRNGYISFLENH